MQGIFSIGVWPPPLHHRGSCPAAEAEPQSQTFAGPLDINGLSHRWGGRTSLPAAMAWDAHVGHVLVLSGQSRRQRLPSPGCWEQPCRWRHHGAQIPPGSRWEMGLSPLEILELKNLSMHTKGNWAFRDQPYKQMTTTLWEEWCMREVNIYNRISSDFLLQCLCHCSDHVKFTHSQRVLSNSFSWTF